MNAATTATNTTPSRLNSESAFRRLFRTVSTQLLRAIDLAGEPYKHGMLPPL
jgi:hypothetical protein